MRIGDLVFRQGHLSEDALTEAVLSGHRPAHLEQCDECSRQALDLSLWLADLRSEGLAAADEAFPAERLALQQSQIMRRLEQLDAPTRVLTFPAHAVSAPRPAGRRVAPAWLGVAAAAGLIIGLVGGQMSARVAPETASVPPVESETTSSAQPVNASILDYDLDRHVPDSLLLYDQLTPTLVQGQFAAR